MRHKSLLFLILCLLIALPAAAQNAPLEGEIAADTPTVDFTLTLTAGTTITLTTEALSPALDPMLRLYSPSGAMLLANDDLAAGERNSRILYEVETSGDYRAQVRGFGGSTGKFEIHMETTQGAVGALIGGVTPYASVPQSRTEDGAFILGDPDAPITIIEFADWACPHCQVYQAEIEQFINEYVVTGQAKYEFRMFPTAGRELTAFVSQLAECAEDAQPGAFWQAYALLYDYAEQGRYNRDVGRTLAADLGLDYADLLTCSAEAEQVITDVDFGRSVPISGTPAVMIRYGDGDAQFIVHDGITYNRGSVPLEVLRAVIEAATGMDA